MPEGLWRSSNSMNLISLEGLGYLLALLFSILTVRSIKRRYFSALYAIPGPFTASITRAWRLKEVYYGHVEKTELKLHEVHGPLVRTGPDEVVTNDLKAIQLLYGIGSKFPKTDFYRLFGIPDVYGVHQFSALPNALHKRLVRFTAAAFSMTSIVELEPLVDSSVEFFVRRIKEIGFNDTPMNMVEWFQWYAFDVIGELTFSTRYGFMEEAKDVGDSTKILDMFQAYVSFVGQAFSYHWLLLGSPLFSLIFTPPSGIIGEMAVREVQARQGRSSDRRDMLSRFLKEHEKNPSDFTMDDVYRNGAMTIGGGSDTTGIALASTLYHLLKSPETYKRLREEIDKAIDDNRLSKPAKLRETQSLSYLQAVIKEGMRIHPSVAFILPRHVPQGGCTIAGKFLPAGTRVGMNPYVVHRNREIFGEDADVFRPERWLERDEKDMNRYMLQFGQGSRICAGRHISIMEMNKALVELIRNFNIELADPKFKLITTTRWFMKPDALPCIFKPRTDA
ncbi:uncharacterized protein A1O9_06625 [Exophiala aquamarina CBS 119918]|uniref:Cytochrome P450 oxidoreductase n=1 Tax=Exophiala aquamarina CBS 119918 TaxID=1182545 RepID=A0A072PEZ8_9EURO|nr:uncharacterized protein A1O9_06625 [Exophiala aquamarina CBS 119918]KEF58699.1 hypothetical protein A1O9_06625 [Exophiala aquamarina CBS 119918]